jgi:hypothetical protein
VPGSPLPAPTPSGPTSTAGGTGSSVLADTDLPPAAGVGQLGSLGLFDGRDPFVQGNGGSSGSSGSGDGGGGSGGSGGGGGSGGSSSNTYSTAHFTINGKSEAVNKGSAFPASGPTFTLVSLSESGAVIGLVQGLFEDGSSTADIAVGEQVTLIAAPDTTRYKIKLVSIS